jgi:hypothetical protein
MSDMKRSKSIFNIIVLISLLLTSCDVISLDTILPNFNLSQPDSELIEISFFVQLNEQKIGIGSRI